MNTTEHRVTYASHPKNGTLVLDTATGRQGTIVAQEIHTSRWTDKVVRRVIHLRPEKGGIEWTTDPGHLEPVA
ncbi:hypothetical protein ACIBCA_36845 [Kitasatospora sp. NPDC051170]|uniref:hypothetical protein n=1 Tax=Kitasatospora sp. NPDC051170 TaxID=3364056 RepID=UPI0037AD2B78